MKYIIFALLIATAFAQNDVNSTTVGVEGKSFQDNTDGTTTFATTDGFNDYTQLFNALSGSDESTADTGSDPATTETEVAADGTMTEANVDEELDDAGRLISMLESQTAQPEWIRRMGIRNIDIKNRYPNELIDFEEFTSPSLLTVYDSEDSDKEYQLKVSGVKASEWCFVTFTVLNEPEYYQHEHKFFFYCPYLVDSLLENLFLRVMLEECTPPELIDPEPLPVKKCHWFFKKIDASYKFTVREMGPVDGADLLECYVEAVKQMESQPRVEILCSSSAIEDDAFQSLTREQYEAILANHTPNGENSFVGATEADEVVKIEAQ